MHSHTHSSTVHNSRDAETASIDRGMDKEVRSRYTRGYYSAIQNNEIMPLAAIGMDPEMIMLRSKSDRESQIPYAITSL